MMVFYTPRYYADIGEGHVFPIRKFELVRDRLLREGTLAPSEIVEPREAAVEDVLLVHTDDYVTRLRAGALTARELRRLGLPWSKALVRRSLLATAGTIAAARFALADGVGANLPGGTHHAFPDHGEGFCVLNDVAIAVRVLRRDRLVRRAAVVDLDVHQGNGTAFIFDGDRLGRLALTVGGLRARDRLVLAECRARGVPVATVMSGGYAEDVNDTVEIHCNTIRAVREVFVAHRAAVSRL